MRPIATALICVACIGGLLGLDVFHVKDTLFSVVLSVGMIWSFLSTLGTDQSPRTHPPGEPSK